MAIPSCEAEQAVSWLSCPSLLSSCSLSSDQRELLEEAACARLCGRFQEAEAIFDSKLPPSYTISILALEHTTTLSLSGRVYQQLELLQKHKQTLSSVEEQHSSLALLLEINLAIARWDALGQQASDGWNVLSRLRGYFRGRGLNDLSDTEVY